MTLGSGCNCAKLLGSELLTRSVSYLHYFRWRFTNTLRTVKYAFIIVLYSLKAWRKGYETSTTILKEQSNRAKNQIKVKRKRRRGCTVETDYICTIPCVKTSTKWPNEGLLEQCVEYVLPCEVGSCIAEDCKSLYFSATCQFHWACSNCFMPPYTYHQTQLSKLC